MNPEAAEWLEAIPEDERPKLFVPVLGALGGNLFSIKPDHERNGLCEWEDWSL